VAIGILGRKIGMTKIFSEGKAIPVTVIECGGCKVTQVKTQETDGYSAVQVGYGSVKEKALTKPEIGHLKKVEVDPLRHLQEFRANSVAEYTAGQDLSVSLFEAGQLVDVTGISIGRGFAGSQKRHNFRRGPMAHGSKNHRAPGSIGAGTTPGRVYPGKKMPGQLGNKKITVRKLHVVRVDAERGLLLVKGAVPGHKEALLRIVPATIVGAK